MTRRHIDARDIFHIATAAELASKVLRDRGERAWNRSATFDPGAPTSRPADAGTSGTRTDDEDEVSADLAGLPVLGVDPVGERIAGGHDERSSRAELRDALAALDTAAARVVDLVDSITRTHTAAPPEDPRGWCPTCRGAGVTQPSAIRDDGSRRYRDALGRCRPCINFLEQHGFDRPALIIQRKAEGRPLSQKEADQVIGRARREHELEQKKAAQRAARRLAEQQERAS